MDGEAIDEGITDLGTSKPPVLATNILNFKKIQTHFTKFLFVTLKSESGVQ